MNGVGETESGDKRRPWHRRGRIGRLTKRYRYSGWRKATVGFLIRKLLDGAEWTYRLSFDDGADALRGLRERQEPAIFSLWHSRMLYSALHLRNEMAFRGYLLNVLISQSRDGDVIARSLIEEWGGLTTRGSSSGGGSRAIRQLTRFLVKGEGAVVTTPDGPRGPVHEVQPGTILLAQLSGVPIYPLSYAAERAWRLSSWDRFIVPLPFSRIAVSIGEPIHIPRDLDEEGREQARQTVGRALRAVDARSKAYFESPDETPIDNAPG